MTTSSAPGADGSQPRYEQELSRSLGVLGNIAITLSAVTPASSVFIIVPFIILTAGTGAILSMIAAALIGVVMAFCWAELSAAYPIAGGDYAVVWHAFKGKAAPLASPVSFAVFALVLASAAFIPAVIALGTAEYLKVLFEVPTNLAGAVVVALATLVAILNIRTNALVTGIFLVIEMAALLVLTLLGVINFHADRLSSLFSPVVGNAAGGLDPVAMGLILTVTASAVFAYNGYAAAVNLSEETKGTSKHIATAILWSLVITVCAELIPTAAVLFGAPDLVALTTAQAPLQTFLLATAPDWVNTLVSLGIAIAIFNAVIAIVVQMGRILYSAARDHAFPGVTSTWLATIHPSWRSPWIATIVVGVVGVVMCLAVDLGTLVTLTGASLVLNYALVALAALVGRAVGASDHSPYKMPFWPIPPILALGALIYVTTQQTSTALIVTGATLAIGLVYWAVVILPQKGRAWTLLQPALDDEG
jgi:amino acid transporter